MRGTGLVEDPAFPAAHDHVVWVGNGRAGLERAALRTFAAARPDERLLLVTDGGGDLGLGELFGADIASGRLAVAAAGETYEPILRGAPGAATDQLATIDALLDEALAAGYAGLRVVAENTAMLTGTETQTRNWLAWEQLTDQWQARRPITGNCYFDASRVEESRLRTMLAVHPCAVGSKSPWRLFFDDDEAGLHLVLDGAVDAHDESALRAALRSTLDLGVSGDAPLTLSLRRTTYLHHSVPFALADLAGHEPGLRITDVPPIVARMLEHLPRQAVFGGAAN